MKSSPLVLYFQANFLSIGAARVTQSRLTQEPDVPARNPVRPHFFVSPFADLRRAAVSYWRKYVHEVLVNRLGGLSLPRKSVVRLTDRPDMTKDVKQQRNNTTTITTLSIRWKSQSKPYLTDPYSRDMAFSTKLNLQSQPHCCHLCFLLFFLFRGGILEQDFSSPGPEVIKLFSCSTQLSIKF